MENRKHKVVSREFYKEQEYQGKKQYIFWVTFEGNEKKHTYTSSVKEPKYFTPGKEQEYTYELKSGTTKDGKAWTFHVVKPIYPKPAFGGGSSQLSIQEYAQRKKIDSISYAMSYAKDLFAAKAIEQSQLSEMAKKMLEWQVTQIDKLLTSNKV